MLEPKKVKSDGRQRPLDIVEWFCSRIEDTKNTFFQKVAFFFYVTGEKKGSMLINFI